MTTYTEEACPYKDNCPDLNHSHYVTPKQYMVGMSPENAKKYVTSNSDTPSISSLLWDLRQEIEELCDDKYTGPVKPISEIALAIDTVQEYARQSIEALLQIRELEAEKKGKRETWAAINDTPNTVSRIELPFSASSGYWNSDMFEGWLNATPGIDHFAKFKKFLIRRDKAIYDQAVEKINAAITKQLKEIK